MVLPVSGLPKILVPTIKVGSPVIPKPIPVPKITSFDWRKAPATKSRLAGSYVTPIRDQKQCGSCVAFGCVAALESALLIKGGMPNRDRNMSEAFLFFCHKSVTGGSCANGWYIEAGLRSLQAFGTVDEAGYPYRPVQQTCTPAGNWQGRLTQIQSWRRLQTVQAMKDAIVSGGPLVTRFEVYSDFYRVGTNIYRPAPGRSLGGHCVSIIGFDDLQRAWICKNSWGTGWGDRGFFRIGYGVCGIESWVYAIDLL